MNFIDATDLRDAVRSRKVKASDAVAATLAKAKAANAKLNAFHEILEEDAMRQAKAVDDAIAAGRAFTLSGDFPTSPILTLEETAAGAHADPSPHMQRVAERALNGII